MSEKEKIYYLKKLVTILKKEKKYLLNNTSEKVIDCVAQKEELAEIIQTFTHVESEQARELIRQIKELQDINLMLTKQAISYNNVFLSAVVKGAKKASSTYAPNGEMAVQTDVRLIEELF
ncbi:hypothetical protein CBF34_01025 [Vagococcus penaei]|uniref:Uncharacterized protein n=1 Tax=Vagococcus penaei TaxID=633807 RepID=A0A1Q2D8C5_9ENTE|nr:flagellar export chaperone FlgN [Vagococcus penaei]AQP54590.1 hypothetical protein BW732_10515 [Vagococcus penaei]RSU06698.1 hypothetical protein CBF34_01025 [Vagococcus penaei]